MIQDYYEVIQKYVHRNNVKLDEKIIKAKADTLKCKFPDSMIKFYQHYGLNNEILNSYYNINKIDDVRIEKNALIFGSTHQNSSLLGIKEENLYKINPPINEYVLDLQNWYAECIFADCFFFNIACWQILNQMPIIAKIQISEDKFNNLCNKLFFPICSEKHMRKGYYIISCQNNKQNILMCFLRESDELYMSSFNDVNLEKFEEELQEDFDWL